MDRWLTIVLVGVTLAAAALAFGTGAQLPDRIATHFDWHGRPNGWMGREGYVIFTLAFGVALPWIVYTVMALLPSRFPRLSKLRDRDYWLAPDRREATLRTMRSFAAAMALVMALLAVAIQLAIVEAHASQPPRLQNDTVILAVVLFTVATIGLAIAHTLRFRRPPGPATHP